MSNRKTTTAMTIASPTVSNVLFSFLSGA